MRARLGALAVIAGCSGDPEIPGVLFGETTFVVVLNPEINDDNDVGVPAPGPEYAEVDVASDDGLADVTDLDGVAVLAEVNAGDRSLAFVGDAIDAELGAEIAAQELRELAVAADGDTADLMAEIVYRFDGDVVEVDPDMSIGEVNDALARSDTIVFFAGGTYAGDLVFAGSNVTLFGEGPLGGRVILEGDVQVSGSGNRIRGAAIVGDLDVPGSDVTVSFSRVSGTTSVSGSDVVLLFNDHCGAVTISGSGVTALGNLGLAPLPDC